MYSRSTPSRLPQPYITQTTTEIKLKLNMSLLNQIKTEKQNEDRKNTGDSLILIGIIVALIFGFLMMIQPQVDSHTPQIASGVVECLDCR